MEYQQIGAWWHGPFASTDAFLCGGCPGTWCGVLSWVVFGTLLGPEATGPRVRCLRLFRGVGGVLVGVFVSGFPAMTVHACCVCGVCGVGLLFENYIVDASILYKKQFPRYMNLDLAARDGTALGWCPLGVVGFRGSLENVFDLCGQVFKSTRWMPWH